MKKKILLAISAMLILMLGIVAFAVNQSNNAGKTAVANSCAMKDMNAQTTDGQAKTSCCDMDDCCCKGDSCPMKKQGENASASCCSCCGDSCPMKNKEAASADTQSATVASGESCCSGGACYKSKKS